MSNECIKNSTYKALLDRREELRIQINKDMTEYKALGDVLTKLHNAEKQLKYKDDESK